MRAREHESKGAREPPEQQHSILTRHRAGSVLPRQAPASLLTYCVYTQQHSILILRAPERERRGGVGGVKREGEGGGEGEGEGDGGSGPAQKGGLPERRMYRITPKLQISHLTPYDCLPSPATHDARAHTHTHTHTGRALLHLSIQHISSDIDFSDT